MAKLFLFDFPTILKYHVYHIYRDTNAGIALFGDRRYIDRAFQTRPLAHSIVHEQKAQIVCSLCYVTMVTWVIS